MKTEIVGLTGTIVAGGALAYKRRFILATGLYSSTGGNAIGVLQETKAVPATGDVLSYAINGIILVESGTAAITAGDRIMSDSAGKAVPATALSAAFGTGAGTATATGANAVIPSGATPVTSSGAQPALTMTQPTITFDTVTGVNTIAGGAPPVQVLGIALDSTSGAGEFPRVKLL